MKLKKLFTGLLATLMFAPVWAGDGGQPFALIEPAQPTQSGDRIEVVEVFWYGCPHCYALEPYLEQWLENKPEDVEFRRIPGVLGRDWMAHARAYYTAEKLGIVDQIHRPLFNAIHKEKKRILSGEQLRDFFAEHGVDKAEFTRIFDSEDVTDKLKQAFVAAQGSKITGVPTMIVNGKYRTSATMAGSYENMITIVNQLIVKERKLLADSE